MSLLSVLILGFGSWHIWEELTKGRSWAISLTKPLTMLLIIAMAWMSESKEPSYSHFILAGLIFSLVGDLFLLFPHKFFIQGLAAFLIAHILYISAFIQRGIFVSPSIAILIGIISLGMVGFLWRSLDKALQIPVLVYLCVISGMAILAISLWVAQPSPLTLYAAGGALLFVISDSALACKQFKSKFRYDQGLIMATYFAAQWLIALSV